MAGFVLAFMALAIFSCTRAPDSQAAAEHTPPYNDVVIFTGDNRTITVSAGEEFAIEMPITFRLGSRWSESHDPAKLAFVDEEDIARQILIERLRNGEEHYRMDDSQYFRFKALSAGETVITFMRRHGDRFLEERVFRVSVR